LQLVVAEPVIVAMLVIGGPSVLVSRSVTLLILVRQLLLLDSGYPSTIPNSNRVCSVNQPCRPLVAVSPSDKHVARIPAANVIAVSDVAHHALTAEKVRPRKLDSMQCIEGWL
jgi:hypothetical protein